MNYKNGNNRWTRFLLELGKFACSWGIFSYGNSIEQKIDAIKNGDVLGQVSNLHGFEDLFSEILISAAYAINLYSGSNPLYAVLGSLSYLWKLTISLGRFFTSLFDIADQTPFGGAYDASVIIDSGFNFIKGLSDGIHFEKDLFKIWKNIVEMIPEKFIRFIPVILIGNDILKLFVGFSYVNSL